MEVFIASFDTEQSALRIKPFSIGQYIIGFVNNYRYHLRHAIPYPS